VLGSSTVELAGVDNNVGSGLQLSPGAFLDAGGLLGQGCVARRAGKGSTFGREGKGGLPPSPDRPLASSGATGPALRAGDVLRVASVGCGVTAGG
jgi:large exoprotein involved in heme utilization and adhesion